MIQRILRGSLAALALALPAIAHANEAEVKKAVEAWIGKAAKVDAVRKAGFLGLYEVQVGGDLIYTDEKASYAFIGNVLDIKAEKNLTEERKAKLSQIKFSDLPLELAIKQVKGNGKRMLATFEDPDCGYCKKLAKELQGITDVTVYTFIYPIFPNSGDVTKAIWCAPDRTKAWNDYMLNGTTPAAGKCDTSGIDKIVALGRKLNIRGTPALIFADGSRVPGFMPGPQLDQAISSRVGYGN
ncbi:MAG: DsbC family protein [Rhodocyclaceae bacterium]|nr:DsbC family protein [Rhodocyclaceae bacterium]